jgi:hypothetical protein
MNRRKVAKVFMVVCLVLCSLAVVAATLLAIGMYKWQQEELERLPDTASGVDYMGIQFGTAIVVLAYAMILLATYVLYNIYRLIKGSNTKAGLILRCASLAVIASVGILFLLLNLLCTDMTEVVAGVIELALLAVFVVPPMLTLAAAACDSAEKGKENEPAADVKSIQ